MELQRGVKIMAHVGFKGKSTQQWRC